MIYYRLKGCGGCYKPEKRRLGTMQSKDEYDCYVESYIKCFWGLCDRQKNETSFTVKPDGAGEHHQVLDVPSGYTARTVIFAGVKVAMYMHIQGIIKLLCQISSKFV